jgi:cell wall-associated NlpC family hydrolase
MWWQKYLGENFAEKGRGPDLFDCWGLLRWVYFHDHIDKIVVPDYLEFYDSTNEREKLGELIDKESRAWKEVTDPKPFDCIVLRMRGVPMHVGIVTQKGYMLHCAQGVGTVHERYDSLRWVDKVLGFYRHE